MKEDTFLNIYEFTFFVWLLSFLAGFIGSLTGLGGGVVIIPLLTLGFGVDIRYAIGASLVSVIATSSGAAAAYVKEGLTNMRLGMFLEIATTIGAIVGAHFATRLPTRFIAVIFGLVLIWSAYEASRARPERTPAGKYGILSSVLRLNSSYPTVDGPQSYCVRNVPGGFGLMFVAGSLSGLLGIGSGSMKVLAMDRVMKIPFKVSTTTSNFMIGVTAAASAGIYLNRGYIDPGIVMPLILGVLAGSLAGSKVLFGARTQRLRILFGVVILILALQMLYRGIKG